MVAAILLLGDSLTQLAFEGWGAKLANVYQRRADVINRGCSGYNTAFYRRLPLPELVAPVALVTIFFGANDASLPQENPHQHVSVEEYSANLSELVTKVRAKYQNPRILLITPPPLDHAQRLAFQKQKYGDLATGVLERTTENTARYAAACRTVADTCDVPCLDLFSAMLLPKDNTKKIETKDHDCDKDEMRGDGQFFYDGLHFSAAGHDFVADQLLAAIAQHFPDLAVTPCPATGQWNNSGSTCPALANSRYGPYHDEIDHTNLDASFPPPPGLHTPP